MPRKSTKTSEVTMNALDEVINTPINFQFDETAQKLAIGEAELRERLESKLNSADVHTWDTIPVEHQPVIDAIARDLDAERSTRKLEPQAEIPQLPEATEPPIIQDEPQPEPQPKRKRKSSALTEKKTNAIQETRQAATQTNAGISETLTLLQAQQGLIDSSQAGTAYLTTYTANLTNVKGEGLTVIAAQMLQEISQKSGFDPNAVLQQVGVPLTPETQQKLQETMGQVLGKAQSAAEEIQKTSWGNGYDLQAELTHLNNLMKSEA
jgi:Zn-dependent metalloprotease